MTVLKLHHWVFVTFATQSKMWSFHFLQRCHKIFSYKINFLPLNRDDLQLLYKSPIREDIWCKFISSFMSTKPLIFCLKRLRDVFLLWKKNFRKRKNWKMHWRALDAPFLPLEKNMSKATEYFKIFVCLLLAFQESYSRVWF